MRFGSGLNQGSSLKAVLRWTSSRDIKEGGGRGLGDCLKGKGDPDKGRSKGQPPRFLRPLVFKYRLNVHPEKCRSSNSDAGRAAGLGGLQRLFGL